MALSELVPQLKALPRYEKVRAIQLLAEELAREEPALALEAGREYPVWTPYNAFEAAAGLQQALEAGKGQP